MDLKERSIYQLPSGRELVARLNCENKVVLYNLSASEPGEYELNAEGRLLFNGNLTAWEMADLLDTGRTASHDLAAAVTDKKTAEPGSAYEQNA
jgi:hypothetical protein